MSFLCVIFPFRCPYLELVSLDLLFCCSVVIFHAFICMLCNAQTHTKLPDSAENLADCMYSYSHTLFWFLSPACSLLPNWNAFLKHFNLAMWGCLFSDALILGPLPSSLLSLDKTFVLFWGAYHAVSLFRSPCKESWLPSQQRISKKGFFVHTSLSLKLSLSLSLSFSQL